MAGDETTRSLGVFMFLPALGEHVFVLRGEEREFADFGKIARKADFALQRRKSTIAHDNHLSVSVRFPAPGHNHNVRRPIWTTEKSPSSYGMARNLFKISFYGLSLRCLRPIKPLKS